MLRIATVVLLAAGLRAVVAGNCPTATVIAWPQPLTGTRCSVPKKSGVGFVMLLPPQPVGLPRSVFTNAAASAMTISVANHDKKIIGADAHCFLYNQTNRQVWAPNIKSGGSGSYTFAPGASAPLPQELALSNVTLVVANEDILSSSDNTVTWSIKCPDGAAAGEDFCSHGAAYTRTLIDAGNETASSHWVTGGCNFTTAATSAAFVCASNNAAPNGTPKDCGSVPPFLTCSDCTGLC